MRGGSPRVFTAALLETLRDIKRSFENADTFQRSTGKNTTFRKLKEATENP